MRLIELNPLLLPVHETDLFTMYFDCPCGCGSRPGVMVGPRQRDKVWQAAGEFPEFSLTPSILIYAHEGNPPCKGWHGFLVNGEMRPCV